MWRHVRTFFVSMRGARQLGRAIRLRDGGDERSAAEHFDALLVRFERPDIDRGAPWSSSLIWVAALCDARIALAAKNWARARKRLELALEHAPPSDGARADIAAQTDWARASLAWLDAQHPG